MLQGHDVRVVLFRQHAHHLQLPVLEALVLEHLLDGHDLAGLDHDRLEHDAERTVADDVLRVVAHGAGWIRGVRSAAATPEHVCHEKKKRYSVSSLERPRQRRARM